MKQHSFLLRRLQGAIGKKWVVKHYRGNRVVLTKYPDMRGIVPSQSQKHRRGLFKKAVAYAGKIFSNPALREEKRRLLRRPRRLFQALIKEWFSKRKEKECDKQRRIQQWQKAWQLHKIETATIQPRTRKRHQAACASPGFFPIDSPWTSTFTVKITDR